MAPNAVPAPPSYRARGTDGWREGAYRGGMSAFRRLHGAVRRHPYAFDLAVAASLYAATLLVTALAQRRSGGHLNALAVLAATRPSCRATAASIFC